MYIYYCIYIFQPYNVQMLTLEIKYYTWHHVHHDDESRRDVTFIVTSHSFSSYYYFCVSLWPTLDISLYLSCSCIELLSRISDRRGTAWRWGSSRRESWRCTPSVPSSSRPLGRGRRSNSLGSRNSPSRIDCPSACVRTAPDSLLELDRLRRTLHESSPTGRPIALRWKETKAHE